MMQILHAIFLGIIQGLTEFLPISSSGHLALAQALFGYEDTGLTFDVFVHFGTVISVIVAFRKDILKILSSLVQGLSQPSEWRERWDHDADFKINWMILIGIIPAGFAGLALKDYVDHAFQNPLLVGCMLLVTALILWSSHYAKPANASLTWKKSLLIGIAQAFAIIPGISRSGSTITAGLWAKLSPEDSAKFSFYLAIPVILGASLIEFLNVMQAHFTVLQIWEIISGTIAAFFSGWIAILFLMRLLRSGKFAWFAIYCGVVGLITIIAVL